MIFNRFDNSDFGTYNVILHATIDEAEEIMKTYNCNILPDYIPASYSETNEDLYLFFIDDKEEIITPVWSFNYAYGRQYNAYLPVHEKLEDYKLDLSKYNFMYFTKWDITRNEGEEREFWTDKRPVFRGKDNV